MIGVRLFGLALMLAVTLKVILTVLLGLTPNPMLVAIHVGAFIVGAVLCLAK